MSASYCRLVGRHWENSASQPKSHTQKLLRQSSSLWTEVIAVILPVIMENGGTSDSGFDGSYKLFAQDSTDDPLFSGIEDDIQGIVSIK